MSISSYKRDVGQKKRKGVMRQREGKEAYNRNGYNEICKFFNTMVPDGRRFTIEGGNFAQLFTKFSVNTMGRSDNIDDMLMTNFNWENDALTIQFGNTKSDQAGETTSEIKRLFANWKNPEICVILGLAVYVWTNRLCSAPITLYEGNDQNKPYYTHLICATEKIPPHIDLGCSRQDIGTHSNRKFSESTAASKVRYYVV